MVLLAEKVFGQQVRQLCLGMEDYDSQVMLKLPLVFSLLQFLEIKGCDMNMDAEDSPMAGNWNSIEKIADSFTGHLTIGLLQLLHFDHLRGMEVSFGRDDDIYVRHSFTKALISAIHNAPSLEKFTIAFSAVEIEDIEDLHARATQLKHLKLENVYLVPGKEV